MLVVPGLGRCCLPRGLCCGCLPFSLACCVGILPFSNVVDVIVCHGACMAAWVVLAVLVCASVAWWMCLHWLGVCILVGPQCWVWCDMSTDSVLVWCVHNHLPPPTLSHHHSNRPWGAGAPLSCREDPPSPWSCDTWALILIYNFRHSLITFP